MASVVPEPTSGWNLPPGCFYSDIESRYGDGGPTCGDCSHLLEGCCDFGICELEFWDAFEAASPETTRKAAAWAMGWIVDHYKDMQEDSCERCEA